VKSRTLTCITVMTLFAALAIPVQLEALSWAAVLSVLALPQRAEGEALREGGEPGNMRFEANLQSHIKFSITYKEGLCLFPA